MFNVREIIGNNAATFYDFDTRKRRSQKPRLVATCIIAVAAAMVCPNVSDNLLAGFLAVQSILLGFTFNVMFFLLANREDGASAGGSIEAELRLERLRDLYHELFYNVSYFNLIAVASIIVATTLLLPTPKVPEYIGDWSLVRSYVDWLGTSSIPRSAEAISHGVHMLIFYAIAIEVIYSIARLIGRTSFYFERKIASVRDREP